MNREETRYEIDLRELATRIHDVLLKKGWSDARFEREAGLSGGSLSRLRSGQRKRISQHTLRRIANVLGESYIFLVFGVEVPRTLQEIPGYADAELDLARSEPSIPIEAIRAARLARLPNAPEAITVHFLRDYLRVIVEHSAGGIPGSTEASGVRSSNASGVRERSVTRSGARPVDHGRRQHAKGRK